MKWKKMGLIHTPSSNLSWTVKGTLTPTPLLIADEVIRVYFGGLDKKGISRIGYVDLNANNPKEIIKISQEPVISLGEKGMFDDNGMILGDIVVNGNQLMMYYIGFQLVEKVKFLAFTGLAISTDKGETFTRYSETPVMDRSDEGKYIRAIHTVVKSDKGWRIWYAVCNKWASINNAPFPSYYICYTESEDGIHFPATGTPCISCVGTEYRIGRPRVYFQQDTYHMYYTKGCLDQSYVSGYASSQDGVNWQRQDDRIGITLSKEGWDSKTLCYPALLHFKDKVYMFYNGNNFGQDGFGCAILEN